MIRLMGIDGGIANVGISLGVFHPDHGLDLQNLWFLETKKDSRKRDIRAKSDDLRRLDKIVVAVQEIFRHHPADVYSFEECPSLRSAAATRKIAMVWGALYAEARRRDSMILEYDPQHLKECVSGSKKASKEEMKEILCGRYPLLRNYEIAEGKREHVADATAALEAAIQDPMVIGLAKAFRKARKA